jgi:hypothetical protein
VIITRIHGGLGNQMFQYAAGRGLSLRCGLPLRLDLSAMARYRVHAYGLDRFALTAAVATPDELPPAAPRSGLGGLVDRLRPRRGSSIPRIEEKSFRFDPEVFAHRGPAHLSGYWQSERWFVDHATTIRDDFRLARPMAPERAEILARLHATASVSVHVRRGDYVSNPAANAFHGTCAPDWYAAAIERIGERIVEPTFFVFSDDPAWVRENLAMPAGTVFVDPRPDGRDAEDLHLMAAARGHVIANSTFSWWAAWLDPRPDKPVIAPARWFADPGHDTRDLIPADWQRL